MSKREVDICDFCDNRIAKKDCAICGKSGCQFCVKELRLFLNDVDFIRIPYCKKCSKNKYDEDVLEKIKEEIIEKMKKGKILEGLK